MSRLKIYMALRVALYIALIKQMLYDAVAVHIYIFLLYSTMPADMLCRAGSFVVHRGRPSYLQMLKAKLYNRGGFKRIHI